MSDTYRRDFGTHSKSPKIKPWVLWAGGGIAVIGVYIFVIRPRATAAAAPVVQDGNAGDGYDAGGYGDYAGAPGGGGVGATPSNYAYYDPSSGSYVTQTGVTTTTMTSPTTNAQWVQMATSYLITEGFDPITVSVALGKYATGQGGQLTANQVQIVQAAIGAIGPTPSSVPPPHTAPPSGQTPKPPGKPTGTPSSIATTVIKQKGTFKEVASRHNMTGVQLQILNPALAAKYINTGKAIPAGTKIRVYVHPVKARS